MNCFKTCPLVTGVVVFSIIISAVTFVAKGSIYADYSADFDPAEQPLFVVMIKGISNGVMPWQIFDKESVMAAKEDDIGDAAALLADASGNDISGNDVSGNDSSPEEITFKEVTDDYFADALFIGDSRTVGLSEYCEGLDEQAMFYAKVSLSIHSVLENDFLKDEDGKKMTVEQALEKDEPYGKIYIMLGLNELGTGTTETFVAKYAEVLARIRELQPDAIIYIQSIMHVTENKSSNDKIFTNERINERNEALSHLANNVDIFYLDMNEAVDDENGNLLEELSTDDIHLKASSYERWHQYLLKHAIVKD
ncbi:GDSL-type esterase/lipase family protein [Butyrivibrio sp. AE2005]|uniref:GDSL-type esterase/lipase family protein n=1 Tax=Butyrivibrio sp. AE2005 TaxID=1496722 RepID=UPI00068AD951|nr:GDSL-type esterase/lipase family protein [Butyrivibrio sp. AE2005]